MSRSDSGMPCRQWAWIIGSVEHVGCGYMSPVCVPVALGLMLCLGVDNANTQKCMILLLFYPCQQDFKAVALLNEQQAHAAHLMLSTTCLLTVVIPGAERLPLHDVDRLGEDHTGLDAAVGYPFLLELGERAPLLSFDHLDRSHGRLLERPSFRWLIERALVQSGAHARLVCGGQAEVAMPGGECTASKSTAAALGSKVENRICGSRYEYARWQRQVRHTRNTRHDQTRCDVL